MVNRMPNPFKAELERLQEELTEAAAMAAMPPPAAVAAQPKEDMSQDDDEEEEDGGAKPDDPLVVHKCLEIIFQLMQDSSDRMSHKI